MNREGVHFEIIIGCEVHVQLLSESKAFCSCRNSFGGAPNSRVCPVCLGLPGALPVVNTALIEGAIVAGLALHCTIAEHTKFDRKNYMYPDQPKNYQISQYDQPICTDGYLDVESDGETRRVRITRLHMEEDAGKNLHLEQGGSLVDFNRCGTPLLEIVSEPDLRSPEEAALYVQEVRDIMRYLEISDCNMEEGSLRCDANINLWIHEGEQRHATPIAEIKNMNSFHAIRTALRYEVDRQLEEWRNERLTLEKDGKSTRGYQDATGRTVLQRTKETVSDYRYFPEPDLPPISVARDWVRALERGIGELPAAKRARLKSQYGLSDTDAATLVSQKALAAYFEAAASGSREPKKVANWVLTEVLGVLNAGGISISAFSAPPQYLRELVESIASGAISGKIAKEVFAEMAANGERPRSIIERKGLAQIADEEVIREVVERVIRDHGKSVSDYRSGKDQALKFLMGQVMRETRGKASPGMAERILAHRLNDEGGRGERR